MTLGLLATGLIGAVIGGVIVVWAEQLRIRSAGNELSRTLVIVPCGKAKIRKKHPNAGPTPAQDAYISSPFKVNCEYARRFADGWMILSAKYGFMQPAYPISGPYNVTFNDPSTLPISIDELQKQISNRHLNEYGRVIGLGGHEYRRVIEQAFAKTKVTTIFPFAGADMFTAIALTKRAIASGSAY